MAQRKLLVLSLSGILLSGCQSWSVRDIDSLPPTASLPDESEQGVVDLRYFDAIEGTTLSNMTSLARYPNNPDEIVKLNRLEAPTDRADNYGSFVRGYIQPPTTGSYRFFVSGDDQTQFALSSNQSASNAQTVASVPSWSLQGEYDKFSSQSSGVIELTAGRQYYFEIRHKEGILGDHFSVAWEGPGFGRTIVDGQYLYSVAKSSELYPDDSLASQGFGRGYRVGFFDGRKGLAFNTSYPPLDEDNDGLYDNWEIEAGLNPRNRDDANSDQDDDLLTAADEYMLGTEVNSPDTDGDGIPDGAEFAFGIDPLDPSDASGDLDNDGFSNLEEYQANTKIGDASDTPVREQPTDQETVDQGTQQPVEEPAQEPDQTPEMVAGFVGQYFRGQDFGEFVFARQESNVSQDWGRGSPGNDIPDNTFSVRWFTTMIPPHAEGRRLYEFRALRDDGIRVYVDDTLVLDAWAGVTSRQYTGQVELAANTEYRVIVEYREGYGSASLELNVVDMSSGARVSPQNVFYTVPLSAQVSPDTDGDSVPDTWEMQNGANAWQADGNEVYNQQGVSVVEAYQTSRNPWTLESVATVETGSVSGDTTAETTAPSPEPVPEPVPEPTVKNVTVSWTAPGTRVDGTSISLSEIDSYQINYGNARDNLNQNVTVAGDQTSYTFDTLDVGTWYFSVQVKDTKGLLSGPSEVVSDQIQ